MAQAAVQSKSSVRFDRKTIDPVNNPIHETIYSRLRATGRFRWHPSTAMSWGLCWSLNNGHFLDIGCGDSLDYTYAKQYGYSRITRVDLFPPWLFISSEQRRKWKRDEHFVQSDAVEEIPLPTNSVNLAISQAMYDLIEPEGRSQFLHEVHRVVKPGGTFACYIQSLKNGWGFDGRVEFNRALDIWGSGKYYAKRGFVVFKGVDQ